MRFTLITGLFLVVLGVCVAWAMGLAEGEARAAGALVGVLLGSSVGLFTARVQRHLLLHRPRLAIHSVGLGMLLKLIAMGAGFLTLHLVPTWGARIDPAGFLVSFGIVAVALVLSGTADLVKVLGRPSRPGSAAGTPAGLRTAASTQPSR